MAMNATRYDSFGCSTLATLVIAVFIGAVFL